MQEHFLRRKDAANYLRERFGFGAVSSLAKAAVVGDGPVFCKRGRIPLYRAADLDDWARSQLTGTATLDVRDSGGGRLASRSSGGAVTDARHRNGESRARDCG